MSPDAPFLLTNRSLGLRLLHKQIFTTAWPMAWLCPAAWPGSHSARGYPQAAPFCTWTCLQEHLASMNVATARPQVLWSSAQEDHCGAAITSGLQPEEKPASPKEAWSWPLRKDYSFLSTDRKGSSVPHPSAEHDMGQTPWAQRGPSTFPSFLHQKDRKNSSSRGPCFP